jgi:hypothetical protein
MGRIRLSERKVVEFARRVGVTAAERVAERIAERARELCPVRSGKLKGTIRTHPPTQARNPAVVVEAGGTPEVGYAAFVVYGTSRHAPNPFLQRAAAQVSSELRRGR